MSKIHQVYFCIILFCFGIAFLQSQEEITDGFIFEDGSYPTVTRWGEIPLKTLRNFFVFHVVGAGSYVFLKCGERFWGFLGGL